MEDANVNIGSIDIDIMLGWFANAMLAQEMASEKKDQERYEEMLQKLEFEEIGVQLRLDKS
jgi:hypothetical protein